MTQTNQNSSIEAADHFIACALSNANDVPVLGQAAENVLPERAFHHGVAALLAASEPAMARLSDAVRDEIDAEALGEAMWDLRHRQVLTPLLGALAEANIPAVLLKGTALAYSLYSSPSLRQRGDTDILVPPEMAEAARTILLQQNFERCIDATLGPGTETNRQEDWIRTVADGTEHAIDLHWGVMHAWSLADLFDTSTVIDRSELLQDLSPVARRVNFVDALYHACLHRGVHIKSPYYIGGEEITGGDRFVWLYDMHLLAPTLTQDDWNEFIARARRDKTSDLCADALARTSELLGTEIPDGIIASLEQNAVPDGPSYFLAQASEGRRFLSNLTSIPGLVGKVNFLRITLFPSPLYMRERYPDMARRPVAALYLRRVIERLRRRPS